MIHSLRKAFFWVQFPLTGAAVIAATIIMSAALVTPAFAQTPPCTVPDNGGGTVNLPPPGCGYVSPNDLHEMINGLMPPGSTIEVAAEHLDFFCQIPITPGTCSFSPPPGARCEKQGGSLGGEQECSHSNLVLKLKGTGGLAGYQRNASMPVDFETHTAPRTPGAPIQSFDTDMFRLEGQLPAGDPDFDLLRITAGTAFSMPSPGHTTLTRMPSGNFNVDSFFDITYRIDFVGHSPGPFAGMSGSTTGTIRMQAGKPAPPPCTVVDDGSGTVSLPPQGCGYVSPADLHRMLNGLPPGTTVEIDAKHDRFIQITHTPGGSLGGEHETFQSSLTLSLRGTGNQTGYFRNLTIPTQCATDTGPRTPFAPVQSFDTDMMGIQGQIIGDPDFDLLRITAGTGFSMPSPGHTTLTRLPSGNWAVDSFFDITYRIDFIGHSPGPFGGMSGSTTGTIRMQSGTPSSGCPPIPAGTDSFPSTAMLVVEPLQATGGPPIVVRLSSAGLPDAFVNRQTQVADTIGTEILSMDLTGSSSVFGPIHVRESPTRQSLGQITRVAQRPSDCALESGDSFFDVFFDVELSALGETWTNMSPVHLERTIHSLPPKNDPYENPFVDPIVLFDAATGAPRARILYERHHVDPPFPPPGNDCFPTNLGLDLQIFGGPATHLQASGPITVQRGGPYSSGRCSGSQSICTTTASCPPGETCNPAQTIDTEMVSMTLTGSDPLLGPYQVRESPTRQSTGQTQSRTPLSSYAADSFFDIFVDIDTTQGSFHTVNPAPLSGFTGPQPGVRNIPPDPGTSYRSAAGQDIPIANQSGQVVGAIRNIDHSLQPPVSWQPPPPPEKYCFDSWITLKITIYNPFCMDTIMIPGSFRILRGGPTDPGDGRDLMKTLMANGLLDGTSQCGGALRLSLAPTRASSGEVRSLAPAENFPADSFFDVFVELDSAALGHLNTDPNTPTHMRTTINAVPPESGEIYYGPGTVIPIYNAAGVQIGEILEVEHIVHGQITCPPIFHRTLTLDAGTGIIIIIALPGSGGGGGVLSDVARGDVAQMKAGGGNFSAATCIANNLPGGNDPTRPLRGRAFYYVARDVFDTFQDTWNTEEPGQTGNRDTTLTACP